MHSMSSLLIFKFKFSTCKFFFTKTDTPPPFLEERNEWKAVYPGIRHKFTLKGASQVSHKTMTSTSALVLLNKPINSSEFLKKLRIFTFKTENEPPSPARHCLNWSTLK